MITIQGKLLVTTIQSGNRSLKTGLLQCSIGQFNLKYDQLDTLDAGEYEGFFEISSINPCCHNHQGKYYFELEVTTSKVALLSVPKALPVDGHNSHKEVMLSDTSEYEDDVANQITLLTTHIPNDAELFSLLWPLGDKVQLDATQSREKLKAQQQRLKQLGYQPNHKDQAWYKAVPLAA